MRVVLIVMATWLPIAAASAQYEPFGIKQGMTVAQLQRATGATSDSTRPGMYHSTRVPNPNSAFESYGFLVSPTTGVCKMWATGVTIENDAYGFDLRSKYESLQAILDQKYGQRSNSYDFLIAGSIWNERRDFMMGLAKRERTLASFWGDTTSTIRVGLQAHGLGPSSGWLDLDYEFSNSSKCIDDLRKLSNSSL